MSEQKFGEMDLRDFGDIVVAIKESPAPAEALRVFINCAIAEGESNKQGKPAELIASKHKAVFNGSVQIRKPLISRWLAFIFKNCK